MILETYSRIFTTDLDATLSVLRHLVGREPELREPFRDMEILTIGDFCIVADPVESSNLFSVQSGRDRDDLAATKLAVEACGAAIVSPITEVMTGQNMFARTRDGVVTEYVEWTPAIWKKARAASSSIPAMSTEQTR